MTRSRKIVIGGMLAAAGVTLFHTRVVAQGPTTGGGPYSSQPLALSWDDTQLAVVNPDANTVSIFSVRGDQNLKISEIPTGNEPWGVAFSSDGTRVYVANRVDGTVSVITQGTSGYSTWSKITIPVGIEPFGIVQTASGNYLYVTNIGSGTVSVIDTRTNQVVTTISNVGPLPRGIAITHGNGLTDSNQVVYVTDFLALPAGNGVPDGFDNAKAGFVTAISVANNSIIGTIQLQPVANTGFDADGNALQGIAPPASPVTSSFTFTTGAYPNQLNTIATKGNFAYVPNTAASPNGPVRFNVNVQSLVNVINVTTNQDAAQTINMQSAVKAQTNPNMLFLTQPWAVAFENNSNAGFVVSAASNVVAKLTVDSGSGAPTVQLNPSDTTSVLEIPTGRNPRGIVINSADSRAYVMNYISRDVTVIDLTQSPEKVFGTVSSTAIPTPGTPQDTVQIGKELFNTSVGIFDPAASSGTAITGRMSNLGWGSCSSCHPEGLSDNVVWIFASGPRRTVPLHATFAPGNATQQRALNWSAIFDQIEDFEGNIRNVSGGLGMFVAGDGITQAILPAQFSASLAGLPQLTVRGVGGWNAIKAYIQSGIRAPISPASKQDPNVLAGQQLFIESNCQSCHGTSQWTTSRVTFSPPPSPSLIQNTEIIGQLDKVGTFNPGTGTNEVRATAAAPLGADGFNPPTLLSLFAFPQTFFHNGAAATLDAVLANVTHRTAGTGGADYLSYEGARTQVIDFLLSIDSNTTPISPQATLPTPVISQVGNAFGLAPQIAPNTWVAVLGSNLAPDTRIWQASDFASNQLPTQLDGVSVTVNGQNAFLYYISPTQINILTPPGVLSGSVAVQVIVGGVKSNPVTVPAQTQSASFFQFVTAGGLPYIYGRRTSDNSLIGPTTLYPGLTTPVKPGDQIYVAGTGFGTTNVPVVSGALSQGGLLPTPWPVITVGGTVVPLTFAGLVADGTYQFNFMVPTNAPNGDVPISATYNGQTTQPGLLLSVHN
jgi:uncharacterized protein (TIGR03437 family)